MDRWSLAALTFAGLCACSALAVAYSQHLARSAWSDISASRAAIDALDVQWSQLQIEQSTFAEHGRIERTARERMGMVYPGEGRTRMIVRDLPARAEAGS